MDGILLNVMDCFQVIEGSLINLQSTTCNNVDITLKKLYLYD